MRFTILPKALSSMLCAALLTGCLFNVEPDTDTDSGSVDAGGVGDSGLQDASPDADAGDQPDPCGQDEFVLDGSCTPCAPGSTREAGDDPSAGDTACTPNTCGENERVRENECVPCRPGSRNMPGDDATQTDTTCDPILCGLDERVVSNACVPCDGDERNAMGDDASGPDTTCDAGLCASNQRVEDGSCVMCELGTQNMAGDDPLLEDSTCDPIECAEGQYVLNRVCTPCPLGTTNEAGDDATQGNTACEPITCDQDQRVLSNQCVGCAPGTTNAAGNDASGDDTTCTITRCEQDERVRNNACIPCIPGATNQAGDPANGTNTTCEPIRCEENERVEAHACVSCAPGSTNPAGNLAPGVDTTCMPTPCLIDQRVSANECVACPPFSSNDAGDLANGADTTCDPFVCGDDEFVRNNTCQSCPINETNEAGDLQGGPNTPCDGDCFGTFGVSCDDFVQAYIKASNGENNPLGDALHEFGDGFGRAISLDGDTLVVGAIYEDSGATGIDGDQSDNSVVVAGAVYVFVRSGDTWTQQAYIKPDVVEGSDAFGAAVAIDGDRLAVGMPYEDSQYPGVNPQNDNSLINSGAVYIFERTGTTWSQTDYIKASNPGISDLFGNVLDLDGDTLVVSSANEDGQGRGVNPASDELSNNAGAVYVFRRDLMGWSQQAYIKADSPGESDLFGVSISIDGDVLAVGASLEDSSNPADPSDDLAQDSGAVYIYRRTSNVWTRDSYIKAPNLGAGDRFGASVDLWSDANGTTLVVGAGAESSGDQSNPADDSTSGAGAVYVYSLSGMAWSQTAYLKHPSPGGSDVFGDTVRIHGSRILVAARGDNSGGVVLGADPTSEVGNTGAVVLFTRNAGGVWEHTAFIKATNPRVGNFFGNGIDLGPDTIVVGDDYDDSSAQGIDGDPFDTSATDSGAAYVYRLTP